MSSLHTYEFAAAGQHDRLAAAEHARAVRAARASAKPRVARIRLHVPRIRFRAPATIHGTVATGQA